MGVASKMDSSEREMDSCGRDMRIVQMATLSEGGRFGKVQNGRVSIKGEGTNTIDA